MDIEIVEDNVCIQYALDECRRAIQNILLAGEFKGAYSLLSARRDFRQNINYARTLISSYNCLREE